MSGTERGRRIHFPGLNGLRFFAALAVLVDHVELVKNARHLPNWSRVPLVNSMGVYEVVCFFVLSGFLITYLLLQALADTGGVSVKKSYLRRILRIWPLYYLVVALGFAALYAFTAPVDRLPTATRLRQLALFVGFVPNAAVAIYGVVPLVSPLWSVGVEEQYYLVWPLLLRRFRRRAPQLMALVVLALVALRLVAAPLGARFVALGGSAGAWRALTAMLGTLKLECMAIGGLGAHALFARRERLLHVVYAPATQLAAGAAILLCTWRGLDFGALDNVAYGVLFTVVVLNLASNPRPLVRLDGRLYDYLGRISYGLYVYHLFVIVFAIGLLRARLDGSTLAANLIIYGLTIPFTVAIAGLSYRFFERPFLERKRRLATVLSDERR